MSEEKKFAVDLVTSIFAYGLYVLILVNVVVWFKNNKNRIHKVVRKGEIK